MDKQVYILWKVKFSYSVGTRYTRGPFCPICGLSLDFGHYVDNKAIWMCADCNEKYTLPFGDEYIRDEAYKRMYAKDLQTYSAINLDLPPTKLQTRVEDEKYFLGAYLTQKDGRRVAIVYVGEKSKQQAKRDYSQIFIDLDQKQLRYDVTNKKPIELLTVFAAEFDDGSTHAVTKGKDK